jgi:hypothetical protein
MNIEALLQRGEHEKAALLIKKAAKRVDATLSTAKPIQKG